MAGAGADHGDLLLLQFRCLGDFVQTERAGGGVSTPTLMDRLLGHRKALRDMVTASYEWFAAKRENDGTETAARRWLDANERWGEAQDYALAVLAQPYLPDNEPGERTERRPDGRDLPDPSPTEAAPGEPAAWLVVEECHPDCSTPYWKPYVVSLTKSGAIMHAHDPGGPRRVVPLYRAPLTKSRS